MASDDNWEGKNPMRGERNCKQKRKLESGNLLEAIASTEKKCIGKKTKKAEKSTTEKEKQRR